MYGVFIVLSFPWTYLNSRFFIPWSTWRIHFTVYWRAFKILSWLGLSLVRADIAVNSHKLKKTENKKTEQQHWRCDTCLLLCVGGSGCVLPRCSTSSQAQPPLCLCWLLMAHTLAVPYLGGSPCANPLFCWKDLIIISTSLIHIIFFIFSILMLFSL